MVRLEAAKALANMPDANAIAELVKLVNNPTRTATSASPPPRR